MSEQVQPAADGPRTIIIQRRRRWPWVLLLVVVVVIFAAARSGDKGKTSTPAAATPAIATSTSSSASAAVVPTATSSYPTASVETSTPLAQTPTPTSSQAPAPAGPAAIGETVSATWSHAGTGKVTVLSAAHTDEGLVLEVVYEAVDGSVPYNPLYWSAKDAEGREYSAALLINAQPTLKSGDLPAGEKARGFIGLDVPAATAVTVNLDGVFDGRLASWSVPAA